MLLIIILVVNSGFTTLQVLEEEIKKECASCKNYEAQLCKIQITSKVKWRLNNKNMQINTEKSQKCANAQICKAMQKYANMQKKICSLLNSCFSIYL